MKKGVGKKYFFYVLFSIVLVFMIATILLMNFDITGKVISIPFQNTYFNAPNPSYSAPTNSVISSNVSYEQLKQVTQTLKNNFNKTHWVAEGDFFYLNASNCVNLINNIGNCAGINPNSPYGNLLLPPGPGEKYAVPSATFPGMNLTSVFHMRSDEAIVVIGISPPESKFFSFLPYLAARHKSHFKPGARMINEELIKMISSMTNGSELLALPYNLSSVMAEIGMPLNDELVNTSTKSSGNFNGAYVLIITADKTMHASIMRELNKILPKYNISPNIINTLELPADELYFGYNMDSDVFNFLNRIAYIQNSSLGDAYLNDPPISVLRIVPNAPENNLLPKFKYQKLPSRETGVSESYLKSSLDALYQAVIANESNQKNTINSSGTAGVIGTLMHFEICTRFNVPCGGNDEDCMYTRLPNFYFSNNSEDFLIMIGINHNATNKAGYHSYAIQNVKNGFGIATVNDKDFVGSARKYLPYIENMKISSSVKKTFRENVDKFIVYKFKRDCKNESYCYQINLDKFICTNSTTGKVYFCEPPGKAGINENQLMGILERAYDDPLTNLGPSYEEVIPPYYVKFVSRN